MPILVCGSIIATHRELFVHHDDTVETVEPLNERLTANSYIIPKVILYMMFVYQSKHIPPIQICKENNQIKQPITHYFELHLWFELCYCFGAELPYWISVTLLFLNVLQGRIKLSRYVLSSLNSGDLTNTTQMYATAGHNLMANTLMLGYII